MDILHPAGQHDVMQPGIVAGQQDAQDRAAPVGHRAGVIGKPAADQDRRRFRLAGAQQHRIAPGKALRRLQKGGAQPPGAEQQILGSGSGETGTLQGDRFAAARDLALSTEYAFFS